MHGAIRTVYTVTGLFNSALHMSTDDLSLGKIIITGIYIFSLSYKMCTVTEI
jgi:hypothetical protein